MKIRYKTIMEGENLFYEVDDMTFCCDEMKNAYENKVINFNNSQYEELHDMFLVGVNIRISFCPWCGVIISTEESKKVKRIKKFVKETVEFKKVIYEEVVNLFVIVTENGR